MLNRWASFRGSVFFALAFLFGCSSSATSTMSGGGGAPHSSGGAIGAGTAGVPNQSTAGESQGGTAGTSTHNAIGGTDATTGNGSFGGSLGGAGAPSSGSTSTDALTLQLGSADSPTRLTQIVDGQDGLHLVGWTQGSLDPTGPNGTTDALVVKLGTGSRIEWVRQLGERGGVWPGITVKAWDAAATSTGELVLGGLVNGRGQFRGQTLSTAFSAFVAKLSRSGEESWTRLLSGTDGTTEIMGIEVLADDSIAVAGACSASTLFDQPGLGANDVFIAWYSPEGDLQRVRRYGDANEEYPTAFLSDGSGFYFTRKVISRETATTILLELSRVRLDGTPEQTVQLEAPSRTDITGLAMHGTDICASVSIATYSAEAGAGNDYELRCFTQALVPISATRRGSLGAQAVPTAVTCDGPAGCAITGFTSIEFESDAIAPVAEAFVARYDASANFLDARHFGARLGVDEPHTEGRAITYRRDHSLVVSGDVRGELFTPMTGIIDVFATSVR